VVRPDIYAKTDQSEFERRVSQADLAELQAELEATREELAGYRCPFCGSDIVEQQGVPLDTEHKHFGLLRSYECGFVELDGGVHLVRMILNFRSSRTTTFSAWKKTPRS